MKQQQQYQGASYRRVQDFLDGHADVAGVVAGSEARALLDHAVTRLAALGTEQDAAVLRMAGQISREKALVAELWTEHVQPISTFARAKLRGVPEFAALARRGFAHDTKQMVSVARAMAEAAAPHTAAFIRGGFPADTIAQLTAATDAVSAVVTERANTKVNRTGATKGIREAILDGRDAVAVLHALISKQFAGDPAILTAWRSARRVTAKPGVPRGAGGTSVVPVAPAS